MARKKKEKVEDDPEIKRLKEGQKLIDQVRSKIGNTAERTGRANEFLPEEMRRKQEILEKEADKDVIRKIIELKKRIQLNVAVAKYDDGDQTPLKGDALQFLKYQWSSGMDCNPLSPHNDHLSGWLRALWWGDYDLVMSFINRVKKDQISKLLEHRESLMNMSAIFHVIAGARTLHGDSDRMKEYRIEARKIGNVKEDHEKIFRKLIELGANIHAKDVAGYTPLHHCLTSVGNSITLSMARELLLAGANPNEQNRFGCTPLMEPIIINHLERIKLLLDFGADPDIKDNDGVSMRKLGGNDHSEVAALIRKSDKERSKKARAAAKDEAGGSLRLCNVCQVDGDTKRCTGCYMVWYCGQKCQQANWSDHKEKCKTTKKQYRDVILIEEKTVVQSLSSKKCYVNNVGDLPSKKHFVVKVQVDMGDAGNGPLLIYNKDKSLAGRLLRTRQEEVFDMLIDSIKKKGYKGLKGYFYAIYIGEISKDGEECKDGKPEAKLLKINPVEILPLETW